MSSGLLHDLDRRLDMAGISQVLFSRFWTLELDFKLSWISTFYWMTIFIFRLWEWQSVNHKIQLKVEFVFESFQTFGLKKKKVKSLLKHFVFFTSLWKNRYISSWIIGGLYLNYERFCHRHLKSILMTTNKWKVFWLQITTKSLVVWVLSPNLYLK